MDGRDDEQRRGTDDYQRPEPDRESPVIRPLFTRTIDLGHILQAIVLGCSAVVYIVTVSGSVADANRKVDDLKVSMTTQITDLRSELRAGLDGVHHQISGLPDATARLSAVERRLDEIDRAASNLAARMAIVEERSIQTQAQMDSVVPATRAPLGPRRQ